MLTSPKLKALRKQVRDLAKGINETLRSIAQDCDVLGQEADILDTELNLDDPAATYSDLENDIYGTAEGIAQSCEWVHNRIDKDLIPLQAKIEREEERLAKAKERKRRGR